MVQYFFCYSKCSDSRMCLHSGHQHAYTHWFERFREAAFSNFKLFYTRCSNLNEFYISLQFWLLCAELHKSLNGEIHIISASLGLLLVF